MGSQREIIKLVWKQLEEIDKLKCEKGSELQNAARTTYLQCCIFRKYVIIEFLMNLIENPMSKMRIQIVFGMKRKKDGAEIEDLRRLPVPKLVTPQKVKDWLEVKEAEATLGPFPYLDLPPEVRRVILDYLTNSVDQLNLAKAIPADAAMMEWSVNSLRLKLILPIVFDRTKLGYQEAVNLCHASDELQNAVKNLFGALLVDPLAAESELVCRGKSVEKVDPADYVLTPLPSTVRLLYTFSHFPPNEDDYAAWKVKQLDILRRFGENVWSFSLDIDSAPSTRKMIQLIRDCVELMPNLRTLTLDIDLLNQRWSPQDEEQIRNILLPDLPYLQHLELSGMGFSEDLYAKLLDKYRSGITYLKTVHFWELPVISTEETGYPRLTHLDEFDLVNENEGMPKKVLVFNTFSGSALKTIISREGYDENKAQDFVSLLSALGQFGETLEHLSVHFAHARDPVGESAELSQLADLNFPNVKTLKVNGYPRSWMFLLSFPALEKLELACLSGILFFDRHPTSHFDSSEKLDLSCDRDREKIYTASIWKLLPFLRTIKARGRQFSVTRSQCLAYQRKSAEIKGLMEQADVTIGGPVNYVMQPGDTTFVVEGDVNGNVVQEGNGCILVTGKVRGKIEQKGNGKIFVRGMHRGALSKTGNGIVEVDWANVKN